MDDWFPMIDWSVNVGNILQIFAIIAGGIAVFVRISSDVRVIRHDIIALKEKQTTLNEAFVQLGLILTQVAVQDNRLQMMEKNIDELRHGQGYIKRYNSNKESN